jgi:hypothetical protein
MRPDKIIFFLSTFILFILIIGGTAGVFLMIKEIRLNKFTVADDKKFSVGEQETSSSPISTSAVFERNDRNQHHFFFDDFSKNYIVVETAHRKKSAHPDWWVSSGAYFISNGVVGHPIIGDLNVGDRWRREYSKNNPIDTDGGFHPQNIFRLVQKDKWGDYEQSVYVKLLRYRSSDAAGRNASNGVFLFGRYLDSDNLYYTGIRVDGLAVIKKKFDGHYHTLATAPLWPFLTPYNRVSNPNQLPMAQWFGLKSVVKNTNQGVLIEFYVDFKGSGDWRLIISALDAGVGGAALADAGHVGLRTDFFDVVFDNYYVQEEFTDSD